MIKIKKHSKTKKANQSGLAMATHQGETPDARISSPKKSAVKASKGGPSSDAGPPLNQDLSHLSDVNKTNNSMSNNTLVFMGLSFDHGGQLPKSPSPTEVRAHDLSASQKKRRTQKASKVGPSAPTGLEPIEDQESLESQKIEEQEPEQTVDLTKLEEERVNPDLDFEQ